MPTKVKKQASSLSFTLSKWFEKISTARPSTLVTSIVVITACIFLFGGGLYDIIVQPLTAYYTGSQFYFLYPALDSQFIFDTVAAGILYTLGFVGLITMYQSSKHAYNPRQAYMMMVLGVTFVFLAYLFLEYFIVLKSGH
jgi:hypothetical protein